MAKRGRPKKVKCTCDDCFNCPYDDCILSGKDVIARETSDKKRGPGRPKLPEGVVKQHQREYAKRHYQDIKEERAKYYKEYYQKNMDRIKAQQKEYRERRKANG